MLSLERNGVVGHPILVGVPMGMVHGRVLGWDWISFCSVFNLMLALGPDLHSA